VIFHGQFAVGFLDFFLSGGSGNFKNFVIVFAWHRILEAEWIRVSSKTLIT
jgi:hypothetical protein